MNWMYVISLFLHIIATVVWIGGLVFMTVLILPETQRLLAASEHGGVLHTLLNRMRRRFTPLANISLLVLVVTGIYQMSVDPHYEGLLQFTNTWSRAILIKHVAVIGMLIVGATMQWGVIPTIEKVQLYARQDRTLPALPTLDALRQRERRLIVVNCILGVLVLAFTAVATSV